MRRKNIQPEQKQRVLEKLRRGLNAKEVAIQENISLSSVYNIKSKASSAAAPALVIDEPCSHVWDHDFENKSWWYVTLDVHAVSAPAKDCCAFLEVVDPPGRKFALHWAGQKYNISETQPQYRDISTDTKARLDVAFAPDNSLALKEGAVPRSPSSDSQDAYGSFTLSGLKEWDGQGCWVAQPLALCGPKPKLSAHLRPGKYRVLLRIYCTGDVLAFESHYLLTSPEQPEALRLQRIDPLRG